MTREKRVWDMAVVIAALVIIDREWERVCAEAASAAETHAERMGFGDD